MLSNMLGTLYILIIGNLYEVVYGHPHPDFVGATTDWAKKYGPVRLLLHTNYCYMLLDSHLVVRK